MNISDNRNLVNRIYPVILFFSIAFSAFEHIPTSAINMGSGLLSVNSKRDPVGVFRDPASVTEFQLKTLGISWGSRFGLRSLNHGSAIGTMLYKHWHFAGGASVFGDEIYGETITGFVMGKKMSENLHVGVSFMMYDLFIKGYGDAFSVGLSGGWRMKVDEELLWYGNWRNLNAPKIGKSGEYLPQIIVSGIMYSPTKNMSTALEWEQDTLYPGRLKFGLQYTILPWFLVTAGHASAPGQTTAGFNILYKQLNFNYAVSTHSHLDLSHVFGLGISFR